MIQLLHEFINEIYDEHVVDEDKVLFIFEFYNTQLEDNTFVLSFLDNYCNKRPNKRNVVFQLITIIFSNSKENRQNIKISKLKSI